MNKLVHFLGLLIGSLLVQTVPAEDMEPLHQRIDQLVQTAQGNAAGKAASRASDAEFVRRLYLDLTGRIPPHTVVQQFLDNSDESKREQLVDKLLGTPQYALHLQHSFDAMLMQRLPEKHVEPAAWQEYLFTSFLENKTWAQLASEVLSADGAETDKRGQARFLLDRNLNIDDTVRDIGRFFLGRDLQCAQCHDHPSIDDYLQQHYYGLSAFLQRSYLFTNPDSKKASIGEKAEGDVKFTSVFTNEENSTVPRLLNLPPIEDPQATEEPYLTKPEKDARGVPRYSRRQQLAPAVVADENGEFRLNIANRIWALLMGRGLVEPLDMMHAANPPSHPELLEVLATDLRTHDYDMRYLVRQLVLSQTYQQSSELSEQDDDPTGRLYLSSPLKPLTPEQLAWSTMQAVGLIDTTRQCELEKLKQENEEFDPSQQAQSIQLECAVHKTLENHVATFVGVFASGNPTFGPTVEQALFLENDELISSWLAPVSGNLIDRLNKASSTDDAIDQLYLAVLSHLPCTEKRQLLAEFLDSFADNRLIGFAQATRAILCSAEFRFNH